MAKNLFAYFKKSPRNLSKLEKEKRVLKPLLKEELCQKLTSHDDDDDKVIGTDDIVVGEIVWAKLRQFPWWPAMVCKHPGLQSHLDNNTGVVKVHIQFFEDPPSWDWVLKRLVLCNHHHARYKVCVDLFKFGVNMLTFVNMKIVAIYIRKFIF